ncbi:hypothetical protein MMRN_58210 [Mycobacterium marinum]|nr:hypothetical protein MMRN_58210 [Mycobacterium marinum]
MQLDAGQMSGQPLSNLRRCHRESRQGPYVGRADAGLDHDAEGYVERCLGKHLQRRPDGQAVQGGGQRAVDRVLDRHAGEFGGTGTDGVECGGSAFDRQRLRASVVVAWDQPGSRYLE